MKRKARTEMVEFIRDIWSDGWVGRLLLLAMLLCVALIPLTIWATVLERNRCVEMGGRMVSKTTNGVGPAVGVAITTSTVSFCVSSDGRILF